MKSFEQVNNVFWLCLDLSPSSAAAETFNPSVVATKVTEDVWWKKHTFNNCCEAFFFCLSSSFDCKERHQVCCARTVDLFFCPTTATSPTLSVPSQRIGTVSKEAEFPSAGQRVKISQSIRVCLPAAAETSRESIWFFSEKKTKLCRAYFKKKYPALVGFCCVDDALRTFGSSYWPRDMRVSLEAFRKHLHTFSRVWVLTVSHIDSARKTRRNHGIIELWNAAQWPRAKRFPVIMWHLGWSRYFLWRAVQLPPGGPACWLRPLTTTSWSCFFVTYQTTVRPNKASALAGS